MLIIGYDNFNGGAMNTLSTELDKFGYGIVYGITRERTARPNTNKSPKPPKPSTPI